jgi:hypothetical protein
MKDDAPFDELLTEAHTCTLLGIDSDALHALVSEDRVLRIRIVGGDGYPAFQFGTDATLLPGLREVIQELCVVEDQWLWWLWLLAKAPRARWEQLRDGDIDTVVHAASRSAWAWREIT